MKSVVLFSSPIDESKDYLIYCKLAVYRQMVALPDLQSGSYPSLTFNLTKFKVKSLLWCIRKFFEDSGVLIRSFVFRIANPTKGVRHYKCRTSFHSNSVLFPYDYPSLALLDLQSGSHFVGFSIRPCYGLNYFNTLS